MGYIFSPWDYRLSFSADSHVGVWTRGFDSRLVFFNDAEFGPYRGSITGLIDADGDIYPPLEHEVAFGDSWGIYYRHFQWSDSTLWTLMVTLAEVDSADFKDQLEGLIDGLQDKVNKLELALAAARNAE